jgi:hypothetical protein
MDGMGARVAELAFVSQSSFTIPRHSTYVVLISFTPKLRRFSKEAVTRLAIRSTRSAYSTSIMFHSHSTKSFFQDNSDAQYRSFRNISPYTLFCLSNIPHHIHLFPTASPTTPSIPHTFPCDIFDTDVIRLARRQHIQGHIHLGIGLRDRKNIGRLKSGTDLHVGFQRSHIVCERKESWISIHGLAPRLELLVSFIINNWRFVPSHIALKG